jgi:serine/threonine protein kinase
MIKNVSRYIKLSKIGEGTYGVIYKAKDVQSEKIVALKKIKLNPEIEGTPSTAIREIALLKELKHPNIIHLLDVIHTSKKLSLIFEYCETDLKKKEDEYLNKNEKLPRDLVKKYFKSILNGLAYLHKKKIIHRDLKPQNLLITDNDEIKICDFGLARGTGVPIQTYTNEVVTLWYRPPDILLGSKMYDNSVDLWSAGCIFGEMLLGKSLFQGKNDAEQCVEIFKIIGTPDDNILPWLKESPEWNAGPTGEGFIRYNKKSFKEAFPDINDENAYDILEKLLVFDPESRASAETILQHPYFKEN